MRKRLVSFFLLMLLALQSVHVMATTHHTHAEHHDASHHIQAEHHDASHHCLTQSKQTPYQADNVQDSHAGHCQANHQFNYLPNFGCVLALSSQVQSLQADYQVRWITIQSSPLFRPPKA